MAKVIVLRTCAGRGFSLQASPEPQDIPDGLVKLLGDVIEVLPRSKPKEPPAQAKKPASKRTRRKKSD